MFFEILTRKLKEIGISFSETRESERQEMELRLISEQLLGSTEAVWKSVKVMSRKYGKWWFAN